MSDPIPFPELTGQPTTQHVAVAPDGTASVVPSGSHDRLRQAVIEKSRARDPSVGLALTGWVCLQSDGLTDRINVDAPDDFTDGRLVRQFARAHAAGSMAVARHPSVDVVRSPDPQSLAFDGPATG